MQLTQFLPLHQILKDPHGLIEFIPPAERPQATGKKPHNVTTTDWV
ncbi:MAG TPA: hypothetical protein VNJ02_08040 [Vicinamibacterales bacterium]|nr:hypothetical protein [Vicinamibacterales bacterium]